MNETELRDGLAYVAAELRTIHESAGDAPLDADTQARFDAGTAYVTETRAAITAIETRRAQVAELATIPANVERGAPEPMPERNVPNVNVRTHDPFDLSEVRTISDVEQRSHELRGRALDAAERGPFMTDEQREAVTMLVERDGAQHDAEGNEVAPAGARAKWILEHGSPEYHRGFRDYVRNPSSYRAAMSTTSANGGYMIPFTLDPTIILTNNGIVDPIRELATVKTITTGTWHGVASAGVTAEMVAEATEVADASPTFTQPTISVYKADAYLQGSMEVVADAAISGEIAMLIGEAKGRLEGSKFAVGTGTAEARGIVTAASGGANSVAGSSGAAGAADLVAADIFALDNALADRWRDNATFLGNKAIANKVRQLNAVAGTPLNYAFWTDFGGANPSQLIGYNWRNVSSMDSTIVSGSTDDVIVLGDVKQYYVVDRMGLELVYNPLVLGSNRRPSGEVGWVGFWRFGGDAVYSGAFKTLRL